MRFTIGTRGSALALAQTGGVADALRALGADVAEPVIVRTRGDRDRTSELSSFGGTGAFTRALDDAQREGRFDVSVHSLKDLPTEGRDGLVLAAVPRRGPVADVIVSQGDRGLDELTPGATVGTGSARRRAQLLRLRPDLDVVPVRGNVGTRVDKVRRGDLDATLLARAGLVRLGRRGDIGEALTVEKMVPAAGQGALAVVVREDAADGVRALVARLDDEPTRAEVLAERAVLAALGGGCHLPLGVLGRAAGDMLTVRARVVSADGTQAVEQAVSGPRTDAERLGRELGTLLSLRGARELLP